MCGFLTAFSFNNCALISGQNFEALLLLSKKRGPDASQIHTNKNYQLGFNRLAILDLTKKGDQPKYSPSKRYHVVFNGEIYNYKELENSYHLTNLKSTSDTEVLVHLLDKLGVVATIKALNGMFAISIIDTETNNCYLARDFAGIKPLFYGVSKNGLVAASQFDQISNHLWFKDNLQLRGDVMKEYFGFGYMQAPNTIYKNLFQVKPGELLKISSTGTIKKQSFKHFEINQKKNLSAGDPLVSEIEKELIASVKKQLVSDVPLATFLSGGIDSPLITAISKKQHATIEAFTIAIQDDVLDESSEASAYAKNIHVKQSIQNISESNLLKQIDDHFNAFSEPFGDYSSIPTYLITKLSKKKYTVMLSGDGGDELFFGYPRMQDVLKKKKWFQIPFAIRKPMIRFTNKLKITTTWAPYHYKTLSDWIKAKHTHIFKTELDAFFNGIDYSNELEALYNFEKDIEGENLLQKLRYNEFYGHLQRILIKVDRMSMANSLEVRVPFLDKNVIDKAMEYEPHTFKSNEDLKRVLKVMMRNYYSKEVIYNQKKGFTVPIDKWLRNQLQEDVKKVIFDTSFYGASIVDVEAIKNYVNDFYNKKHNSSWGIWHIYAWQKWAISKSLI